MPYINGTEVFSAGVNVPHEKIFEIFQEFMTGFGPVSFSGAAAPTRKGYGEITDARCTSALVNDETITVTCTNNNPNTPAFSVVGSTSGAMPDATANVAYENAGIRFTILLDVDNDNSGQPDVQYQLGDAFVFTVKDGAMVTGDIAWDLVRDYSGAQILTDGERGALLKGRGSGGSDNIYVSAKTRKETGTDMFWWEHVGGKAQNLLGSDDGIEGRSKNVYHTMWEGDIDYYIIANSRHFKVATRLGGSGVCTQAYHGFGLPYAIPSRYTYPVFVGASSSSERGVFPHDSISHYFRSFFDGDETGGQWNMPDNTWVDNGNTYVSGNSLQRRVDASNTEPWVNNSCRELDKTPAGEYYLLNAKLVNSGGNVLMLDGVYYVPGASPLAAFDTITVGGDTYLVVSNHQYISQGDFAAFKLE